MDRDATITTITGRPTDQLCQPEDFDLDAGRDDDGEPWPDALLVPTTTITPSEAYL